MEAFQNNKRTPQASRPYINEFTHQSTHACAHGAHYHTRATVTHWGIGMCVTQAHSHRPSTRVTP
jgi:hypothetical protein